eukprot:gene524-gene998
MAFSMENESLGRPAMVQERMVTWSPKTFSTDKTSLPGISFSLDASAQAMVWPLRNSGVNAPRYAMMPAETIISPVKLL